MDEGKCAGEEVLLRIESWAWFSHSFETGFRYLYFIFKESLYIHKPDIWLAENLSKEYEAGGILNIDSN